MVVADPRDVLLRDAIVGIQVSDGHLVEVVALLGQHADHPAPAPVHGRRLADDDPGLERILDAIETAQLVPELCLQAGHVLPTRLVGLARDYSGRLLFARWVGGTDRPDALLEHSIGLRLR